MHKRRNSCLSQATQIALAMVAFFTFAASAPAQVFTFTREQMIRYTARNPFERFSDGRPKVPDTLLNKLKDLSLEEVWAILPHANYHNQYEGGWKLLHPEQKLVGRAVTAQFMPYRPDVDDVIEADAHARGLFASQNQRVIDSLQPGDVIVVDLFGKKEQGTFIGDNLATAIFAATKGGGFVIDGAIRDLDGIFELAMPGYYRSTHPTPIGQVMLTGVNIPIRIGDATVMPGDAVLGDREGVYFIPPELVQKVVDNADEIHIHDEWTKAKLMTGKYKSSEIYSTPKDPALKKEYEDYLRKRLGRPPSDE
jgi:regulator of RNase E activity RraA